MLTRELRKSHDVLQDLVFDVHAVYELLHGQDLTWLQDAARRFKGIHVTDDDLHFVFGIGIADQKPHQEAIDLRS